MLEAITLAFVQGITEAFPVSSSAHLLLVRLIAGWQNHGSAFDVAVHVGTLLAIGLYFYKEIVKLWLGFWQSLLGNPTEVYSKLSWLLIIASLPVAVIGVGSHYFVAHPFNPTLTIAFSTIGFGLLLWASDYFPQHSKQLNQLGWKDAMVIGFAQTLSLIPGASRLGTTMTAGLFLGFDRNASATFSFLLSIPAVIMAATYESYKITTLSEVPLNWPSLLLGIGFAALPAYFCLHLFFYILNKMGVVPFVLYRLFLGTFLLLMFL